MTSPSLEEKFELSLASLSDNAKALQSSVDLIQSNTRMFQHQVMRQMQEGYSRNHMNALMAFTQVFSRMNAHIQEVNEFINRIIIDTDSGKCRDESGMLNLNNEDDLVRVIANCRYE